MARGEPGHKEHCPGFGNFVSLLIPLFPDSGDNRKTDVIEKVKSWYQYNFAPARSISICIHH